MSKIWVYVAIILLSLGAAVLKDRIVALEDRVEKLEQGS